MHRAVRDQLRDELEQLDPFDERERLDRSSALAWVDSGAPLIRTSPPRTPPEHLVAYCAVVSRKRDAVLLVDHRRAGLWLPAGGHVEPGEHTKATAARELREELGMQPHLHPAFGESAAFVTRSETVGETPPHIDVSLWYVFLASPTAALSPDTAEIRGTRWWPADRVVHARDTRFGPEVPRFVAKLRAAQSAAGSVCARTSPDRD